MENIQLLVLYSRESYSGVLDVLVFFLFLCFLQGRLVVLDL